MSNETIVAACVAYEERVKHSDYDTATLTVVLDNGETHKRKIPQFAADKGVEGLFYVYDEFENVALRLNFAEGDYWEYWPDVLDGNARRKWSNQVRAIAEADRDIDRFKQEFSKFVGQYTNSTDPRGDLIRYIDSDACNKPRDADVDEHVSRIETLCLYANRLPGIDAELSEDVITSKIFKSFAKNWRDEYELHSGRPGPGADADARLRIRNNLVEFMKRKKGIADSKRPSAKKKESSADGDDGKKRKKRKFGQQQ